MPELVLAVVCVPITEYLFFLGYSLFFMVPKLSILRQLPPSL